MIKPRCRFIPFLLIAAVAWQAEAVSVPPRQAAIASAHPLATAAGFEILDQGGNAFDAAVAVAAALAVVEPQSSGLGGGGFWLIHRAADGYEVMVDGRETAPAAAHRDMYLGTNGQPDRNRSLFGPLAAGIPGMPAGIAYLNTQFGALPLATCLAPAIRLAREGFPISPDLQRMLSFSAERLRRDPGASAVFLTDGAAPPAGAILKQPALANTLERIARAGIDAFYRGEIATALVAGVRGAGGIWTVEDFTSYQAALRPPIVGQYRDVRIVSAPPPSSGGVVLVAALNILEHFDLAALDATTRRHLIIEALRNAYRDRAEFLGDPDFVTMPIERLISKSHAGERLALIDPSKATPSSTLPPIGAPASEGNDTTHFSVLDTAGNRVAGTMSINTPFGAGFLEPATGIVLNNEMDDFATSPMTPNAWDLVGMTANAVAPGRRPLSSMSPTFVETAERVGILGTPGGSRIISMVLLGVLDFAAGHGPGSWVAGKRFHHQYLPDQVQFEPGALAAEEQEALRRLGHTVTETRTYGDMHAILWNKTTGDVSAASDPRGEGLAQTR